MPFPRSGVTTETSASSGAAETQMQGRPMNRYEAQCRLAEIKGENQRRLVHALIGDWQATGRLLTVIVVLAAAFSWVFGRYELAEIGWRWPSLSGVVLAGYTVFRTIRRRRADRADESATESPKQQPNIAAGLPDDGVRVESGDQA